MDMQHMIDGMNAAWQRERAATQLTLGKLIAALEAMPADAEVANLIEPHSYRGYYCDLAFERGPGKRKASELLADCRAAMGAVFEGYKGGDYVMGALTPVWVASYGQCGPKIVGITASGGLTLQDDD